MSSPVSKAKQPSIHAFFSGASKKKPAAGAGKEEKAKQDQVQLGTKRSEPDCETADDTNKDQVWFIRLLDVLSSPVIPSIAD
jgi:hypothetical protein